MKFDVFVWSTLQHVLYKHSSLYKFNSAPSLDKSDGEMPQVWIKVMIAPT